MGGKNASSFFALCWIQDRIKSTFYESETESRTRLAAESEGYNYGIGPSLRRYSQPLTRRRGGSSSSGTTSGLENQYPQSELKLSEPVSNTNSTMFGRLAPPSRSPGIAGGGSVIIGTPLSPQVRSLTHFALCALEGRKRIAEETVIISIDENTSLSIPNKQAMESIGC